MKNTKTNPCTCCYPKTFINKMLIGLKSNSIKQVLINIISYIFWNVFYNHSRDFLIPTVKMTSCLLSKFSSNLNHLCPLDSPEKTEMSLLWHLNGLPFFIGSGEIWASYFFKLLRCRARLIPLDWCSQAHHLNVINCRLWTFPYLNFILQNEVKQEFFHLNIGKIKL